MLPRKVWRRIRGFAVNPPNVPATHQFLFDHIPRTGGLYFASVLSELVGSTSENFDCGPDYPVSHASEILRLDRYRVVVGHLRLDTIKAFQQLRPRHVISLVRDPASMIGSTYSYWRYNVTEDLPHCNLAKELTFSEFIRRPDLQMSIDNPLTRHLYGLWDLDRLETSESTKLLATRMADSYAFIGVTERMDDSVRAFRKLFRTKHVDVEATSHDRNASKSRVDISEEDRAFLVERNGVDYAVYGHVKRRLDEILKG